MPRNRVTPRRQAQLKRNMYAIGILLLVLIVVLFFANRTAHAPATSKESSPSPESSATPTPTPSPADTAKIESAVQDIVDAHEELIIGVSFVDLHTNTQVDIGSTDPFIAASTGKLIPATLFLRQVEAGKYTLNTPLGSSTANYHLKQMINQSNNDSWALFNDLLTRNGEQSYAKEQGWTSYSNETNSISAHDTADLLAKVYNGKLINDEHKKLLFSLMQDTNEESLIPAALPEGATVYHKYGMYEDNVHDASIISYKGHTFVLTIYTNGKGYYQYDVRTTIIHDIVKAVINNL